MVTYAQIAFSKLCDEKGRGMSKFIAHTATDMGKISYENIDPADFQSPADPTVTYGSDFIQYDYGMADLGNYQKFSGDFQYTFAGGGSEVSDVSGNISHIQYKNWYTEFGALYDGGYEISDFSLDVSDFQTLPDAEITEKIFFGDDTILGSAEKDTLMGFAGADLIKAGVGDDFIDGGTGDDIMLGGRGIDTYYVDNARDVVWEFASEGIDTVQSTISYRLPNYVEDLILLGTGSINGTGNTVSNTLTGNDGANVLNGREGRDTIYGGKGDDTLYGGEDRDTMYGGEGDDTYYVDSASDVAIESPSSGLDLVYASITYSIAGIHIEKLTLTGSSNINATGNGIANTLTGNTGNNTLLGDAGNDRLIGGAGADRLYGGTEADSFIFLSEKHSTMTSRDMIYDFSRNQGDKISLSVIDANAGRAGNQAFIFVGERDFSNKAQELRYSNANGDTYIYGDINGDGNADFSLRLDGNIEFIRSDFIL